MAGLRKIKQQKKEKKPAKKKKITTKKKPVRKTAVLLLKPPLVNPVKDVCIERPSLVFSEAVFRELPLGYGEDKICLMVRDPWWLYTYWEVTRNKWEALKQELGQDFYTAKKLLRVYDINNIIFNGNNAHRFFDIELGIDADNWYINTDGPGRSWCVDLGLRLRDGRFITIIRSNAVNTPIDGPSWISDEEWMIPEDMFSRLYSMGFGFGRSSPGKAWAESMKRALFSGVLASPGRKDKGHKM